MKAAVNILLLSFLLLGCRRAEQPVYEAAGIVRTAQAGDVTIRCYISETNMLTGATALLKIELEAPAELELDMKRLDFDGFLVFAESHPAYSETQNGTLLYRHIYHLQARQPGSPVLPEIALRIRAILTGAEPTELIMPALPITVRGVEVRDEDGLKWSDPVEVGQ